MGQLVKVNHTGYALSQLKGLEVCTEENYVQLFKGWGVETPPTEENISTTAALSLDEKNKIQSDFEKLGAVKFPGTDTYLFAYKGGWAEVILFESESKWGPTKGTKVWHLNIKAHDGDMSSFENSTAPVNILYTDGAVDPDAECKKWKARALKAEETVRNLEKFLNLLFKGQFGNLAGIKK